MSLTLNMVGGGSGGLVLSKPLLHVIAQLGSTVEISFGGIVVKTIPPSKAFPNEDGINADYYYSASATGTYTITAIQGALSKSVTETVTTVKQYDVKVPLLVLYYEGDEKTPLTGGWSFNKNNVGGSTLTKNDDSLLLYTWSGGNAANGCTYPTNPINTSGFSTVKCFYDLVVELDTNPDFGSLALRTTAPTNGGYEGSWPYQANCATGTNKTVSCNISTATAPLYVVLRTWATGGWGKNIRLTIRRVWLE